MLTDSPCENVQIKLSSAPTIHRVENADCVARIVQIPSIVKREP